MSRARIISPSSRSRRSQEDRGYKVHSRFEKRKTYAKSDVFITRELASLERWRATDIEDRSLRLAEAAVRVFPHPKRLTSSKGARAAGNARLLTRDFGHIPGPPL